MEQLEKETLLMCRPELVDKVQVRLILDVLVAHRVICTERRQIVKRHVTEEDQMRELLDQLEKSDNPKTFDIFCYSLEHSYPFLAMTLRNTFNMFKRRERFQRQNGVCESNHTAWLSQESDITIQNPHEDSDDSGRHSTEDEHIYSNIDDSQGDYFVMSPTGSLTMKSEKSVEKNKMLPGLETHNECQPIPPPRTKKKTKMSSRTRSSVSSKSSTTSRPDDSEYMHESATNVLPTSPKVKTSPATFSFKKTNSEYNEDARNSTGDKSNKNSNWRRSAVRRKSSDIVEVNTLQAVNKSGEEIFSVTLTVDKSYPLFGLHFKRVPGGNEFYVTEIDPGSPAAMSGYIEPNDTILMVNDIDISDKDDKDVLHLVRPDIMCTDSKVKLSLKRYDRASTIAI